MNNSSKIKKIVVLMLAVTMLFFLAVPRFIDDQKGYALYNLFTLNSSLIVEMEIVNSASLPQEARVEFYRTGSLDSVYVETVTVQSGENYKISLNEMSALGANTSGQIRVLSQSENIQASLLFSQKNSSVGDSSYSMSIPFQPLIGSSHSQNPTFLPQTTNSLQVSKNKVASDSAPTTIAIGQTSSQELPVPFPTVSATLGEKRKACKSFGNSVKCIEVEGEGVDECVNDSACSHTYCDYSGSYPLCKMDPHPGINGCSSHEDCHKGTICSKNMFGLSVCQQNLGSGFRQCNDRFDCLSDTHCTKEGKCSPLGDTGVKCTEDADCRDVLKHTVCESNVCKLVEGIGDNQCEVHADCQGLSDKHLECVQVPDGAYGFDYKCIPVSGLGQHTCSSDTDCVPEDMGAECSGPNQGFYTCKATHRHSEKRCDSNASCIPSNKGTKCDIALDRITKRCIEDHEDATRKCESDVECNFPSVTPIPSSSPIPTEGNDGALAHSPVRFMLSDVNANLRWNVSSVGSDSAKVRIELYQDVNCGMCKYSFNETFSTLVKEYVATGKVKLEIKEFPLIPNNQSIKEVKALYCAGKQNSYPQYLTQVYAWDKKMQGDRDLSKIASTVNLDLGAFNSCLESPEALAYVKNSIQDGKKRGVNGTPTIFINGKEVGGALPLDVLKKTLNEALLS